jgi:FtsH-binding integral membrane protein
MNPNSEASAVRGGLMSKVSVLLLPGLISLMVGTYFGAAITSFGAVLALAVAFLFGPWIVKSAVRAGQGIGFLALLGWGLVAGLFMGPAIHQYVVHDGWQFVFNSYLFTTLAMLGFGAYGYLTSKNFASWAVGLFVALLVLLVILIINIFVPFGGLMMSLIGLGGMVLFSLLFIFDFNRLKYEADNWDNAFDGTISIMLDFMNFLNFFMIFFGGRRD